MYTILNSKEKFDKLNNDILLFMRNWIWDLNATKWCDLNKHQSKELYACIIPEGFGYPVQETRIYKAWDIEDEELIGTEYTITTLKFELLLQADLPSDWYPINNII